MGYRVKFQNPATGNGFIDHYKTARRAKQVVAAYQAQFAKDGNKGVFATYLGKPLPYVSADPALKQAFGL